MTAKNPLVSSSPPPGWDKQQVKRQAYFLQSSAWGDFNRVRGVKTHYLADDGWSCLLLERQTSLGRYIFAPYGPALDSDKALGPALAALKTYGLGQKIDWLSLEPVAIGGDAQSQRSELLKAGARPASHNRDPDLTRVIDLKPAADDMLALISQSTRSFIRKNQREKLLSFRTSTDPAEIAIFIQMLKTVSRRNSVDFFPDDYFNKQAKVLMPAGILRMELALEKGQPLASALILDYGTTSAYTYAASLPEARRTNASALLLWQAMLNAKQRGMRRVDLFGIAPDGAPASHPWQGFSAFKSKFGGSVVQHAGTWDVPLSGKYRIYRSAQKARKILRRH